MSGEFIVWLSPSTKCEQSLGNEDMEEGSHEIKESIIIPTKALPSVNQSELTGKSEEPSTSSIQNGTAKGYFLKISGKHFLCAAAPLWLHRQASPTGSGTLIIIKVISPKDELEVWQRSMWAIWDNW